MESVLIHYKEKMIGSWSYNLGADDLTEYDTIKEKLRLSDDSMRDEIQIYMHEISSLVNNRLRNKLGVNNIYGEPIVLPLTFETIPPVDLEIKSIANNLVVSKIRLQNSEKPLLWDAEVKVLDNYLEQKFGYTRDVLFQPKRTLTILPRTGIIGSTITLAGTNYKPVDKLKIVFDSTEPTTTPATVITTTTGTFTGITFTVPANQPDGSYEILVSDSMGGVVVTYQVTS